MTIDDVPTPNEANNESTQLILDAIAAHNQTIESLNDRVRATFFIISIICLTELPYLFDSERTEATQLSNPDSK